MARATEILSKVTGVYVSNRTQWGEKPKTIHAVYSGKKAGKFIVMNGKKVNIRKLSPKKYQLCFSEVEMDTETRRWGKAGAKRWLKERQLKG